MLADDGRGGNSTLSTPRLKIYDQIYWYFCTPEYLFLSFQTFPRLTLPFPTFIALFSVLALHLCIPPRVLVLYSFLHQFRLGIFLVCGDFNVLRLAYKFQVQNKPGRIPW